jgi:hypothetical protein
LKHDNTTWGAELAVGEGAAEFGNMTLSGTTLTYSYTCIYGSSGSIGLIQSGTATWDNTGKLTGTWQNVNGFTTNGTLTLTSTEHLLF